VVVLFAVLVVVAENTKGGFCMRMRPHKGSFPGPSAALGSLWHTSSALSEFCKW
jgi:hypothetical protein